MATVINACNMSLQPMLVRMALKDPLGKISQARCHTAQKYAWINVADAVAAIEYDPNEFPDIPVRLTMGGIPIVVDDLMLMSTIFFKDADGKEIARIENLAIPTGFQTW